MFKISPKKSQKEILLVAWTHHPAVLLPDFLRKWLNIASIEDKSIISQNVTLQHSNRARLRFQCFLNSLLSISGPPVLFFNGALNGNDISKIFCQGLIRRFEQPFLCCHQVLYSLESAPSHYEMRPLFVAPRAVQIALYEAFLQELLPRNPFLRRY